MFGNVKKPKETPESNLNSKTENFMNKLGMSTNFSKNSRVTIIVTLVALFTILMISAGYFVKKYGNNVPKIEPIKLPTVPKVVSAPIDF